MELEREQFWQEILDAYKDLAKPSYHFVERRQIACMHGDALTTLRRHYTVIETTDLNDDVCLVLSLKDNQTEIGLRLSLVGKYACLSGVDGRILERKEIDLYACIAGLKTFLQGQNYLILGRTELARTFPFGGQEESLYRILFSTDEAMSY